MKARFIASLLSFCLFGLLNAEEFPHWNIENADLGWNEEFIVLKYTHHSELQRQWAWHLLGNYRFKGDEHVLDFGCGDGKITAEVSHFVAQGKVTGVDLSPTMINFASRSFPTAYFPNLSFRRTLDIDYSDASNGERYDLIYSFCVFHLVANPIQVLTQLQNRMTRNGLLYLVVPCGGNPSIFIAADEMFEKYGLTAPWARANDGSSGITMRSMEGCAVCLLEAGFEPLSIVHNKTPTVFFNRKELIDWFVGTTTANWNVPVAISESFFSDLVDKMAEIDTDLVDPTGCYHLKLNRFEVIAKPHPDDSQPCCGACHSSGSTVDCIN